jgi:hypothetical protein
MIFGVLGILGLLQNQGPVKKRQTNARFRINGLFVSRIIRKRRKA